MKIDVLRLTQFTPKNEENRLKILTWLQANNIHDTFIPFDSSIDIEDGLIKYQVYATEIVDGKEKVLINRKVAAAESMLEIIDKSAPLLIEWEV